MNAIKEVLTIKEISILTGRERTTIQRMIKKHLIEGQDYRNSPAGIIANKESIKKIYNIEREEKV